jgi:hypothetical protein
VDPSRRQYVRIPHGHSSDSYLIDDAPTGCPPQPVGVFATAFLFPFLLTPRCSVSGRVYLAARA